MKGSRSLCSGPRIADTIIAGDGQDTGQDKDRRYPLGEGDLGSNGHVHAADDKHVHNLVERDGADEQGKGKRHGDDHAGIVEKRPHR